MVKALFTSYNALLAHQTDLDVTANNVANVNTTAFKRSRAEFEDLLYQNANLLQGSSDKQVGSGVNTVAISKMFEQGALTPTSRSLDVAIEGDGFLAVLLPNGDTAYTRDGALQADAEGRLVTSHGFYLIPELTLPPNTTSVGISPGGVVTAVAGFPPTTVTLGVLTLSRFINPQGLEARGGNIFRDTASSGPALTSAPGTDGAGRLRQAFLERSNVQIGDEMTHLIIASRAFQLNTRVVVVSNDLWNSANQTVRF